MARSRFAFRSFAGRQDDADISPDGRNLVFSAVAQGKGSIWLRPIGSPNPQMLPGSDPHTGVATWSPDSRSIAFNSGGVLKRIDLGGGAPQTLCPMPNAQLVDGATAWNRDGIILFTAGGKIYRVPATGGEPAVVLGSDQPNPDALYLWPAFLPDGRHFLYLRRPVSQAAGEIYLASLDGKENTRLLAADSKAVYSAPATGRSFEP